MASALYLDRPFFGSRRMGSPDKTLKFYEGSFHDPLNDNDKGVVMQDILGWINARIPPRREWRPGFKAHRSEKHYQDSGGMT